MTPHQKSALEIGGLVLAAAAVIWYVTSSGQASADTEDQSLPVYGGSADPSSTTAAIPSVTPLSAWNTSPQFPPYEVPSIIWPSSSNNGLANLLQALNPQANNCCGCPADAAQALVTATPYPYGAASGTTGVNPPAPGISTLAQYIESFGSM